jgi:hypothetical protein
MPLVGVMTKDNQRPPPVADAHAGVRLRHGLPPEQAWRHIYEVADALLAAQARPAAWQSASLQCAAGGRRGVLDPPGGHRAGLGGRHSSPRAHGSLRASLPGAGGESGWRFRRLRPLLGCVCFGVLAYRLLTGTCRVARRCGQRGRAHPAAGAASGLAVQIDSRAARRRQIAAENRLARPAQSKWEERRRNIIERALDLNPAARWADMREVVREFEVLESDYLLEESREQTVQDASEAGEKGAHAPDDRRLAAHRSLCSPHLRLCHLRRAQKAETTIANIKTSNHKSRSTRENRIATLTSERDIARAAKAVADSNLQNSQNAVDQFLTQLLQTPPATRWRPVFSREQLQDALNFCMRGLPALEQSPALGVERLRAYGNIGQIHLSCAIPPKPSPTSPRPASRPPNSSKGPKGSAQMPAASAVVRPLQPAALRHSRPRRPPCESLALLKEATVNLERSRR